MLSWHVECSGKKTTDVLTLLLHMGNNLGLFRACRNTCCTASLQSDSLPVVRVSVNNMHPKLPAKQNNLKIRQDPCMLAFGVLPANVHRLLLAGNKDAVAVQFSGSQK